MHKICYRRMGKGSWNEGYLQAIIVNINVSRETVREAGKQEWGGGGRNA